MLHNQSIFCQDIKPANFTIDGKNNVYLVDFETC